jgi:hypothetical protein
MILVVNYVKSFPIKKLASGSSNYATVVNAAWIRDGLILRITTGIRP